MEPSRRLVAAILAFRLLCQQPGVPGLDKAPWQNVMEEAADEPVGA